MPPEKRDEYDWIEFVVRLGKALGMNPVRIRWKLRTWQDRQKGRGKRVADKAKAVRRAHKTCPACNGISAADDKVCAHCGAKLHSRPVDIMARALRQFNLGFGTETVLVALFVLAYALVMTGGEASTLWSLDTHDLIHAGANYYSVEPGIPWSQYPWQARPTLDLQYFRLLTYAFLHAGLVHIGFNCVALLFIAPPVREIYGGAKALITFLAAALMAGTFSLVWATLMQRDMVSIGASGGIAGLIGMMAVWGHLDRTHLGIRIRNSMLRWILYMFIFGFVMGADHAAHVGGLLAGGLLAMALPVSIRRAESTPWRVAAAAGWAVVSATVGLIAWMCLGS
ncbi:MAG: rhomboid family intramembrane serine protease [Pseudomonadota bacterium]